jgi:CRP-like cAMP-binding protein
MMLDENPACLHINRYWEHARLLQEVFAERSGARTTRNLHSKERITTFSEHTPTSLSDIHQQTPISSKIDRPRLMRQKVDSMGGYQVAGHAAAVSIRAHRIDYGTPLSHRAERVLPFPLFSNISSADYTKIVSVAHQKDFHRRQTIFLEGDPVRQILVLTSGCAKITQLGQNGTEVILRLNGPGDVVGVFGDCSGVNHRSTARSLQLSTALIWEAAVFEGLMDRFPILRRNTVRILGERLLELEERFREVCTEKVASRLSSQIIRLLDQVGRRVNGTIEISLSREELAQLTGTTLFTVSRLLSEWEQRGILVTRRKAVSVRNFQALEELSESE